MRRQYGGFTFVRGFQEHYNHSLGRPISSERQLRSEFARASDEHAERTGFPANFQPVHPEELRHTVDGAGLEATHRAEVEQGKREVRSWR